MRSVRLRVPLSSLLDIQNGYAFDSKRFGKEGLPLIRIRDLRNGFVTETRFAGEYDKRYIVRSGDFLIGMDGEFACYEWKGKDALLNQRVCKLYSFSKEVHARFLFLGINRYLKAIEDNTSYTTVKHISSRQILEIEMPFPPLKEQERIVAILDEAFEGIATLKVNANKILASAFELFESRVAEVFTARGEGWKQQKLDEVCNDITVGHVGSMREEYRADGIPFLRSQNIRPFHISLENVVYIDAKFNTSLKKSQLYPGDLAIVRTGYPGTAAVIPPDLPISNCSDLVIVRPGPALNSSYLAHFFNSTHGKQLVLGNIVGSAQKHFNIGAAKNVPIPVPSVPQQRHIVSMLDKFRLETQRLEAAQLQKLEVLEALKQSLLDRAFSGNL